MDMAKKIKLTEPQKNIIIRLNQGYELARRTGWGSNVWIQKVGDVINLNYSTLRSMLDKGLIQKDKDQSVFANPQYFELTDLGKTVAAQYE